MKILDLVKKSFHTVVENPTITLFFVLFLIISNFLAPYIMIVQSKITALVIALCIFFLTTVFLSGWFQMLKETAKEEDISKLKDKNYLAIFLEGISKNGVAVTIGVVLYLLLLSVVLFLTSEIAFRLFGSLDFIFKDMMINAAGTIDNAINYIQNLSDDQKFTIYGWQFSFVVASMIYNFFFLFLAPSVVKDDNKNQFIKPFIAFVSSVCFAFKNFFGTLSVFFIIYSLYFFLGVAKAIIGPNVILSILILFVYIYFISGALVLIFNYYEQKTDSVNRCDCIGEDKPVNSVGEAN